MKALLLACALLSAGFACGAEPAPPAGMRLGDAATPQWYQLQLAIDPVEKTFSGEVRIDLLVNRPTGVLWLNAQGLDIEEASFTQGIKSIPVRVHRAGEDLVGFEATQDAFLFGTTTAVIRYKGPLEPDGTRGLFRRGEGGSWYVVSQFEALNARRAIPSFDEPGWKTPWDVTIDAPASNRVFSNAPETSSEDVAERPGWKRHRFARTGPLPTYLVALGVGPFDTVPGMAAGKAPTPLRYIAARGRGEQTRFAQAATPRLIEILEAYFGRAFPFEKLDSLAIPSSLDFGAMENAGLITYAPTLMLARRGEETAMFQRSYASVAAHEMAHQWFGDLVTLAWWDDIWLNEAFATWMARKTLREYRPEFDSGWRHGDNRRRALAADRLTTARQVHNPVNEENDVYGAFDSITYSKGAEVLSMFESRIGEETFRRGVRDYIARHAGGNATSRDFFEAVGEAAGRGAQTVEAMRTFVDQAGLPLVDVALSCGGGAPAIKVSQRRFAGLGRDGSPRRWITPACFRYRAGGRTAKQCVDIAGDQTVVLDTPACPDWIVGNADGAGEWVARYDAALLQKLDPRIVDLPEDEAVALAGDTALLVESGLLSRDAGLRLADGFLRHASIGVRHGGIYFLEKQRDEVLSGGQRQLRHTLLVSYVQPLARSLGWLDRPNDAIGTQELRAAVMPYAARMPGGEALRPRARDLALRWVDDRTAIPASSVHAVVQTAARFADAPTYERLESALTQSHELRERAYLIDGLPAARDPALRLRALELALRADGAGALDAQEALRLFEAALEDDANRVAAFAFLRQHWDEIAARVPPDSAARLLRPLQDLCTRRDRQDFVAFCEGRAAALRGGPRRYAQSLESIDVCVASSSAGQPSPAPAVKKRRARGKRR